MVVANEGKFGYKRAYKGGRPVMDSLAALLVAEAMDGGGAEEEEEEEGGKGERTREKVEVLLRRMEIENSEVKLKVCALYSKLYHFLMFHFDGSEDVICGLLDDAFGHSGLALSPPPCRSDGNREKLKNGDGDHAYY